MKKTLLLSVVASTMIMAGGDIAPVEPVVEVVAPVAEASAWKFGGSAVAYTQTVDNYGDGTLFDDESTYAGVGIQLKATNTDIFSGIGAGVEVAGIVADNGTGKGFYAGGGTAGNTSGGITQAYLTYGMGATNIKVGRQTLPKSLSPFAYSEGWQIFKNTFDAALVVNTSLPSTTLVYAFIKNANRSVGPYLNEDSFASINGSDGGHMITAQNKSISGLTLTGSYYTLPDASDILWGDAKFKAGMFNVAVQGGQVDPENGDATTAFGAKVGAKIGIINASVAYSSVSNDNAKGPKISNITGVKSPLYTQTVLNNVGQYAATPGSDFLKLFATAKALGGTVKVGYGAGLERNDGAEYSEIDLMYVTKITKNTKVFAAYVYTDQDIAGKDSTNFVRFWARYSF